MRHISGLRYSLLGKDKSIIGQKEEAVRAEFTRHFYEYARENPNLKVSYTQWTAEHGYHY